MTADKAPFAAAPPDLIDLLTAADVISSLPVAVYVLDLSGQVVEWNAAATQLLGWSRDEVARPTTGTALPVEQCGETETALAWVRSEGHFSYETTRQCRDGDTIAVAVDLALLTGDSGTVFGILGCMRDATPVGAHDEHAPVDVEQRARIGELLRSNAQLETEARDLRETNQRLRQFARTAAHDLAQPLTVMGGYLELIDSGSDTPGRVAEWLATTRRSQASMVESLDALLRHANSAEGELAREDVAFLVHRAVEPIQGAVDAAGATVALPAAAEISVNVALFSRVVQNLVLNSCRYRSGDRPLQIRIVHEPVDDVDVVRVIDNGVGFGPGEHDAVFAAGRRGSAAVGRPGTGAGLATVRSIVEDLGGKVWAEDTPGGGATIAIALPRPAS